MCISCRHCLRLCTFLSEHTHTYMLAWVETNIATTIAAAAWRSERALVYSCVYKRTYVCSAFRWCILAEGLRSPAYPSQCIYIKYNSNTCNLASMNIRTWTCGWNGDRAIGTHTNASVAWCGEHDVEDTLSCTLFACLHTRVSVCASLIVYCKRSANDNPSVHSSHAALSFFGYYFSEFSKLKSMSLRNYWMSMSIQYNNYDWQHWIHLW